MFNVVSDSDVECEVRLQAIHITYTCYWGGVIYIFPKKFPTVYSV